MTGQAALAKSREILASGAHLASPAALAAHLSGGMYRRAAHLDYLSDLLVDVAMGDCIRLMVLMPPRSGKSETTSHWFPAWFEALFPEREIILGTHGLEFSREWGRKTRGTIKEFFPELGVEIAEDSDAAHRWNTREGGGMHCVGVGGDITGRGGQVLILDDCVKDAQEAQSPTIQRRNWEWWKSTFRTRATPKGNCRRGAIIVVGTPWDKDDLIGRLRAAHAKGPGTEGYEPWTIVHFPAVATEPDIIGRQSGDALWPEMHPLEELRAIEVSVGPHWWAALYQGNPVPAGGDLIKESWWNYWVPAGLGGTFGPVIVDGRVCRVVELPADLRSFQSWDFNFRDSVRPIEEGREPDPVAGHVWAHDDADMYLLDRFHGAVGLGAAIEAVREMTARNPTATTKLVEETANGPAVMAALRRDLGGFVPVTPIGSKIVRVIGTGRTEPDRHGRAVSMQAYAQGGNMYLPHPDYRPWATAFRGLLGQFPKGGKDDTDAASQAWAHARTRQWSEQDQQQREAQKHGEPPKTTADILRKRLREGLEEEYKRSESPRGASRRRAFYLRRRR